MAQKAARGSSWKHLIVVDSLEGKPMDESQEEIALLRSQGLTPKQIARRLGLRPAEVTQIVRSQAAERNAFAPSLPPAVGCFLNAGWSAGLGFEGEAVAWRDLD